jgi:hypothetical protein
LLNVAAFDLAATFHIGATPQVQRRAGGETANFDVWIARLGGFSAGLDFSLTGLPAGASWTLQSDPMGVDNSAWRRVAIELPSAGTAGTHDMVIRASGGGIQRTATVRLHFDGTPTTMAGGPMLKLRSGVQTKIVALPARVTWAAVTGATQYQLQASRDGGAWQQVTLPTSTATQVNRTVWPGSSYQHRLRAKRNGVWGAWVRGPRSIAVPRYAQGDGVSLTGSWAIASSPKAYGELPAYSTQKGSRATLAFNGRSVSWIAMRGPKRGKARVFIDGVLATTVDLYASSNQYRRVVFSKSWTQAGPHSIEIRVLGTSGRPRVDLDALVVVGDP